MTVKQMIRMDAAARKAFFKSCDTFSEKQSLKEYTEAIRDYIFLYNRFESNKPMYAISTANWLVENDAAEIKALYDEKLRVSEAVIYVEYSCG